MKKNAFTLIELLAIIVILAIIAVITVPIILDIIENSRKGAAIESAYNYKDSINKYYLARLSENSSYQFPSGFYDVEDNGVLTKGADTLNIMVSGSIPSDGWVKTKNGEVIAYSIKIGDYTVTMLNNEISSIKNGDIAEKPLFKRKENATGNLVVGEELDFATEHFNIISTDENETVLLAKWNLLVGINYNNGTRVAISDEVEGYGWQNENATGVTSSNLSTYVFNAVVLGFSNSSYWHDGSVGNAPTSNYAKDLYGNAASYSGNPYPYVYDSNCNLYGYINDYRKKLETIGANIINARLLAYEEAASEGIGCSTSDDSCPDWISNTSFYLGSVSLIYDWHVYSPSKNLYANSHYSNADRGKGVRPVIVISTSDVSI